MIVHIISNHLDHTIKLSREYSSKGKGKRMREHICKSSSYSAMRLQHWIKDHSIESIYFGWDIIRITVRKGRLYNEC